MQQPDFSSHSPAKWHLNPATIPTFSVAAAAAHHQQGRSHILHVDHPKLRERSSDRIPHPDCVGIKNQGTRKPYSHAGFRLFPLRRSPLCLALVGAQYAPTVPQGWLHPRRAIRPRIGQTSPKLMPTRNRLHHSRAKLGTLIKFEITENVARALRRAGAAEAARLDRLGV